MTLLSWPDDWKGPWKLIRRRMLAQHFFQVHFALTSKDVSAFFDGSSNQQGGNKAWNLSVRLPQFTNMMFLQEKCGHWDKVGLPYLHSLCKRSSSFFLLLHSNFFLLLNIIPRKKTCFFFPLEPSFKTLSADTKTTRKSRQTWFFKSELFLNTVVLTKDLKHLSCCFITKHYLTYSSVIFRIIFFNFTSGFPHHVTLRISTPLNIVGTLNSFKSSSCCMGILHLH